MSLDQCIPGHKHSAHPTRNFQLYRSSIIPQSSITRNPAYNSRCIMYASTIKLPIQSARRLLCITKKWREKGRRIRDLALTFFDVSMHTNVVSVTWFLSFAIYIFEFGEEDEKTECFTLFERERATFPSDKFLCESSSIIQMLPCHGFICFAIPRLTLNSSKCKP